MIEAIKQIDDWQNKTHAAILAELQADPRTVRDITTASARTLMRERSLWLKDPITREMDLGKIGKASIGENFPPALFEALVELNAALYDQSAEYLRTASIAEIAVDVATVVSTLQQMGVIDADDVEAFYALGGGKRFIAIEVEDVRSAMQAEESRIARETLEAEWTALLNDGGINAAIASGDRAALVTALDAASAAIGGE